jgi:hypothetical protein
VRRNPLLLDQPAQKFARAVSRVGGQPLRLQIEPGLGAVNSTALSPRPGCAMSSGASATMRSTGWMSCCPGAHRNWRRTASPPDPTAVKPKQAQPAADAYDDPTRAAFAFLHANAFAEAGHEIQIFLLGEAGSLMKDAVMNSVVPVGWPPLSETIPKTIQHKISPPNMNGLLAGPGGRPV